MEKRTILAISLIIIVIIGWTYFQSKFFPPAPQKPPSEQLKKEELNPKTEGGEKKAEKETNFLNQRPPGKKQTFPKKEVSIETQNYLAVFTTEDARLVHFKLKKYEDRAKETEMAIKGKKFIGDILGRKAEESQKSEPVDLVNTIQGEDLPLGLILSDSDENWKTDKDSLRLLENNEKGEIIFSKSLKNGLKVLKHFKFNSDQYIIQMEVEVQNSSSREIPEQPGLEWIGKIELNKLVKEGNKDYGLRYSFLRDQKVEKKEFGSTGRSGCVPSCGPQKTTINSFETTEKGDIKWFSFGGEYFASLIIPPPSREIMLSIKVGEKDLLKADIMSPTLSIPPNGKAKFSYTVYLGPKDENRLKELGVSAEKVVDFGFFTIIAKPLLWFLRFTHHVTKNYGIDIILISILIKIIFLPLTQISMKSMKEMQKVQPEMNRIKEQYKDDKAKLQEEIMLLYKRRKINPMSGCLPMLIQIPVFFALYQALQNGIEMRHAPFFLWITDLSTKDPIYVTPIIMGATMFIQQKMTPTATADPAQAKMFMFMPILFTFFFLNMPSGLVLYWLINNVLSIAHQYYLNKQS